MRASLPLIKDPINLLTASAQRGELIVIVGTGVSMALTNGLIPNWKKLIEHGFAYGKQKGKITETQVNTWKPQLDSSDIDEFLGAAEFMSRKLDAPHGDMYARWLDSLFKDASVINKEMESAICAIHAARIPIGTLNYDTLLERITGLPTINFNETSKVTGWVRKENPGILHLHGL